MSEFFTAFRIPMIMNSVNDNSNGKNPQYCFRENSIIIEKVCPQLEQFPYENINQNQCRSGINTSFIYTMNLLQWSIKN